MKPEHLAEIRRLANSIKGWGLCEHSIVLELLDYIDELEERLAKLASPVEHCCMWTDGDGRLFYQREGGEVEEW